jgi:hypothetical protein
MNIVYMCVQTQTFLLSLTKAKFGMSTFPTNQFLHYHVVYDRDVRREAHKILKHFQKQGIRNKCLVRSRITTLGFLCCNYDHNCTLRLFSVTMTTIVAVCL